MKKAKKLRFQEENDFNPNKKPIKPKRRLKLGPKKQHFSKHSIPSIYDEEE